MQFCEIWHKGRLRVTDYHRLDNDFLKRAAHQPIGNSLEYFLKNLAGKATLTARRTKDNLYISNGRKEYRVYLRPYQLTYGVRYWFGCPHCGRRCLHLYIVRHELPFICRECLRPAYTCQNSSELIYVLEKMGTLKEKLWSDDEYMWLWSDVSDPAAEISSFESDKPKGRWWSTFRKDIEKLKLLENRAWNPL